VPYHHRIAWLDDEVLKGAFYMEVELIEPGPKSHGGTMPPHTHDHDEIIGFIGLTLRIPEIWAGEIKYMFGR